MERCAAHVEQAMAEVQQIHEVVEEIANVQDKADLTTLGINPCSCESSDGADDCVPGVTCVSPEVIQLCTQSLILRSHGHSFSARRGTEP